MKFATKLIHAGIEPDPATGAIMTPIYQTSTYVQDAPGVHKGYEYARTQNPTRTVLEKNLAALENGTDGICFASGLAATDAILKMLKPGDEVIASNDLYGGSYRLMVRIFQKFGIKPHFVDMTNLDAIQSTINENTRLIWIETPTNPLLRIVDISKVCALADQKGIMTCVDNTFASPYLQKPLDLGADLVIHSATKYLGGHSDTILGAVVASTQELADELHFIQNASGAVPGPMDCFLVLRGIKTLHVRVRQACKNAKDIANYLKAHPKIKKVHYPGFEDHPGHAIAAKQMKKFGAMVSFELKDIESLIGHPASMTHGSIPREERIKNGLSDSLIRLSVGIEDIEDLIGDLETALAKV
ncbi:MAG: PLP-dependent transferase [Saprospiraceae bacterium]|nr:PLP-dependent transferase [Saprospiraceae bacterium]